MILYEREISLKYPGCYPENMKNLSVGIFHDETLGRELGKKGTESDIAMFNRKAEDHIYTFLSPVGDKLIPKSQIMPCIDAVILSITTITPEIGETILMLDAFGISTGIIVVPPYSDLAPIKTLTKNTSVASYQIMERHPQTILDALHSITPQRDASIATMMTIDHAFNVRGIGEVFLGFVKQGTVKKHESLLLLPANKDVIIRSIQMQDKDVDEAEAGSRVGCAIKGASVEEMPRGSLFCPQGTARFGTTIPISFKPNTFYTEGIKEGLFHVTVGMQTVPVTVKITEPTSLVLEAEKPMVYTQDDTFLLLNLNARKLHLIGHGKAKKPL